MRNDYASICGLVNLIESLSAENMQVLEIGSYAGESANIFMTTRKVSHITCIDLWESSYDADEGNTYSNMEQVEKQFDERMSAHAGKFTKFKGTIDTYIRDVLNDKPEPGKFDLVYIDALHTYEGCKNDITKVMQYLKPSIAISGHDYADWPEHIQGVKRAVNEIFTQPDMTFCDTSWLTWT